MKRSLSSSYRVANSLMGLFMITLGLASTYAITTFGPKLSLQSKIKAMKSKMKADASSQQPNHIIR
jgi:hypothetical protein